jgi:hypothetical protein
MYWAFDRETKWKVIYDAIFDKSIHMIQMYKDTRRSARLQKKNENASSSNASSSNASSSNAAFAEDDRPTEEEEKAGRKQLNRILYKEFVTWWDAFVAEAKEDNDEDAPTAEERFSLHSAKVIERYTGLPRDELIPIVGAWLNEHLGLDDEE